MQTRNCLVDVRRKGLTTPFAFYITGDGGLCVGWARRVKANKALIFSARHKGGALLTSLH